MAMNEEYLETIKELHPWIFDKDFKAAICVTDDLDSFLSTLIILKYRPDWEIGYFYSFDTGLYMKQGIDTTLQVVGADLSHPRIRCFSNHLTVLTPDCYEEGNYNKQDVNLNTIDKNTALNYFKKYNLNTFLLVASIFGFEFKTEQSRFLSLIADSAYWPFEQPKSFADSGVQKKYLCDVLGYPDVWDVQNIYPRKDFIEVQKVQNYKSKLHITEVGIEFFNDVDIEKMCEGLGLECNLWDFTGDFRLVQKHRSDWDYYRDRNGRINKTFSKEDKAKMFTFVATSKAVVKYSMPVK